MKNKEIIYQCWAIIILLVLSFLILISCAKERIVYRDVNIPIRCNAEIPQRPIYTDNITEMGLRFIEYMKQLEVSLKYCKGV